MAELQATAAATGTSESDSLVEIDHVVFGYDASRTILNDVSLTFGRGKVTAILGGSGCGKTTLLRLIGGVYPPNSGSVRVDGQVVDARDDEQLFALRRRLGMNAGARIEVLEEPDGLKLRVIRPVAMADVTGMAGMAKAPARGVPRRLEDFDPASLLTRSRRGSATIARKP